MAKFPFMPLYWADLRRDTDHLSDAEFGLYMRVLDQLWHAPSQRVPNDDVWLARRFRRDENWVQKELRPILSEFCQSDGNWIRQKRLSHEFKRAESVRESQSVRAKARWDKEKGVSRGNAESAMRTPRAPAMLTTTTTTKKKDQERNASGATELSGVEELGMRARSGGAPCAPADAPATGTPTALAGEQKPEPKKTGLGNGSGNGRASFETPAERQLRELAELEAQVGAQR